MKGRSEFSKVKFTRHRHWALGPRSRKATNIGELLNSCTVLPIPRNRRPGQRYFFFLFPCFQRRPSRIHTHTQESEGLHSWLHADFRETNIGTSARDRGVPFSGIFGFFYETSRLRERQKWPARYQRFAQLHNCGFWLLRGSKLC